MRETKRKRPSSKDVAKKAWVSRATVSAYINKSRYVSPELSDRIQKAIDELNYIPDPLARALKTSNANTIGLILPVISDFYVPMINAIKKKAYENGYELLISSSDESEVIEHELLDVLVAKRVTGIIIIPCSNANTKTLNALLDFGIPVVQVNREIEELKVDSVVSNNFKAAYKATKYLINLRRKRIVLFGFDENNNSGLKKKLGYETAMREYGLSQGVVIPVKEHDREFISRQIVDFIDRGTEFDAVIATSQGKTVIALKTLLHRGYRIPEDVALIGFDDAPWAELVSPPLTMISEDIFSMGEKAVSLLLRRIEGFSPSEPVQIKLGDKMIIRQST